MTTPLFLDFMRLTVLALSSGLAIGVGVLEPWGFICGVCIALNAVEVRDIVRGHP